MTAQGRQLLLNGYPLASFFAPGEPLVVMLTHSVWSPSRKFENHVRRFVPPDGLKGVGLLSKPVRWHSGA